VNFSFIIQKMTTLLPSGPPSGLKAPPSSPTFSDWQAAHTRKLTFTVLVLRHFDPQILAAAPNALEQFSFFDSLDPFTDGECAILDHLHNEIGFVREELRLAAPLLDLGDPLTPFLDLYGIKPNEVVKQWKDWPFIVVCDVECVKAINNTEIGKNQKYGKELFRKYEASHTRWITVK
jgi:hypothetical protein